MKTSLIVMVLASLAASAQANTLVFSNDFDTTVPAQVSPGAAAITPVQGYAGLGPSENEFAGSFLQSPTGNTVTLALTALPDHDTISLAFLFAAIDSLDGTGDFPSGDFLTITLDGTQIFRESFANAIDTQIQSYVPPPGVELARRVDLGFGTGGFFLDSAYNLALEPAFQNLPHTASTATFTFLLEGPGIQPLNDESWAMDNLRVTVDNAALPPGPIPEPATALLLLLTLWTLTLTTRPRHTLKPGP